MNWDRFLLRFTGGPKSNKGSVDTPPPFEAVNDLERALVKAATDPAARPDFYRCILASQLYVSKEGESPRGYESVHLEKGTKLTFRMLTIDGKTYLPVFTSLPRLQVYIQQPSGYYAFETRDLLEITRGGDLFMNPGSAYGKYLLAPEIASILDGSIWKPKNSMRVDHETKISIGQPARYPKELVEALGRLFQRIPGVQSAYLAHYFNPETTVPPHTLIAIEADGEWDPISAATGIVINAVKIFDPPVDVIPLGKSGLESYFRKECQPFYRKM